jgi:hypothetical protein
MPSFQNNPDFRLDTLWDNEESSNDFPTYYSYTEQWADCINDEI